MIAIIDYQISNIFSVKHAFDSLGAESVVTSDPRIIAKATSAILPGVGAFGDCMANLHNLNLVTVIQEFIKSGRPFMGVCLGFQLLFSTSSEFGQHKGLDVIKGDVKKFPPINKEKQTIRIPQISWNQIYYNKNTQSNWQSSPLKTLEKNEYMYFVHSYYVEPKDKEITCALTNYSGFEYCSSIIQENIFAVQFHPEKSGPKGIEIYKNWINA